MERLKPEWENFNAKYFGLEIKYGVNITDKFWKDDFREMQTLVSSAEDSIKTAKLMEAHADLEEIRQIMIGIRHRNGISYALDDLVPLEEPLAAISAMLPHKEKLTDKDYTQLRDLSQQAQDRWKKALSAKVEATLFNFDALKMKNIEEHFRQQQKNLLQIDGALYSKDRAQIAAAVDTASAEYLQIYRAFGDFQPILEKIKEEDKNLLRAEEKTKPKKEISSKNSSKKKERGQRRKKR